MILSTGGALAQTPDGLRSCLREGEAPVTDHPIFSNGAFEPEMTHAMGVAFDDVCRALFVSPDARAVREAIADKIIEHARSGERDPDRLRDAVLRHIGVADRLGSPATRSPGRRAAGTSQTP
jgi:hypothetical protein